MADDTSYLARVLLVGKRARILDDVGQELRAAGLHVREETDIDLATKTVDGTSVDVVAVSRAFRNAKREELVVRIRSQNPQVRVVDGLAPLTPVVVAQVLEAALDEGSGKIVGDAAFEDANNRLVLVMNQHANVGLTLHRLDGWHRAHEVPVYDGPLDRGIHNLPLFKKFGGGERFLVAHADGHATARPLG